MSHSLIGADHRTHGKIVAVALAASISLVMLSIVSWRADTKDAGLANLKALTEKSPSPAG